MSASCLSLPPPPLFFSVPPIVVPFVRNQSVVVFIYTVSDLRFLITDASPSVISSDIHWYYYIGNDIRSNITFDSNSGDYREILDITSETDISLSEDRLRLTFNNITYASSGKYYFRASNRVGEDSSYIDVSVIGKIISSLPVCHLSVCLSMPVPVVCVSLPVFPAACLSVSVIIVMMSL